MMRIAIPLILVLGCGSKEIDEEATGPTGGGDNSCIEDSECASWQICENPDCVDGDRNNETSEATSILKDSAVTGFINTPDDKDYYAFEAGGGEYIRAAIHPHDEVSEGSPVPDNFLTLYGPDGSQITSADDYPNGGTVNNYDSVVYAYLAEAGTYILEVSDANPLWGNESWGGADYTYSLEIGDWSNVTWGSSSFAEPMMFGSEGPLEIQPNTWHVIGVVLEEAGEVDYFQIDYPFDPGNIYIDGLEDLSGSNSNPWAALYTMDELALTQRDQVGPEGGLYHPLVSKDQYVIAAGDADGGGGDNDWFAILINADERDMNEDGNPFNLEQEPNDEDIQANAVEMTATENTSGKPFSYGYGWGFADEPGDTDWFSITVEDTTADEDGLQWLVLCMNSLRWGSTIAPDITVYTADGTELGTEVGSSDAEPNLRLENLEITSPGETLYVHVDPGEGTTGTEDEWYIFKTYVASFQVTSYEEGGYTCP